MAKVCVTETADDIQTGGRLASNQRLEGVQQAAATITQEQSMRGKLGVGQIKKGIVEGGKGN